MSKIQLTCTREMKEKLNVLLGKLQEIEKNI